MLTAGLKPGNEATNLEVLYFAAKSIYDGFDDENWNSDTISFISTFFGFIFQEPATQDNFSLAKGCLQFIYEFAKAIIELKQYLPALIQYCLKMVSNEKLRGLALNTIFEIC